MAKKQQMEHDGVIASGKLNELQWTEYIREDGSRRVAFGYEFCPTLAEQHTAHLSNLNYLMEKYQPDELAAYIAARTQHRVEILGHDFSAEPTLQEAKNQVYKSKQAFEALPDHVKDQFKSHIEFLKFIDNPANEETILKLGIVKKRELENIKITKESGAAQQSTNADAGEGQAKK